MIAGLVLVARPSAAQSYLSEDFESGLPSSNFAPDGQTGVQWTTNNTYAYGGSKSAYFQTSAGNTNGYVVSRTVNLASSTRPLLTFYHIAALEKHYDQAIVEVSTNGGVTWVIPNNTQYNGNSWRKTGANTQNSTTTTFPDGPFFDAESRPEWDVRFTSTGSMPVTGTSLWAKEVFDLSAFKSASFKVRFRVKSNGTNDYFGWLVDNVSIQEAPSTRISGTRVIGTGGFASFRDAAQALADSGVGTGGVTFLVSPGTYNDSVQFGYWNGVSAANRVRFKANGGQVIIQRAGSANSISNPTYSGGWSYSYFFDAVVLMSGAQYVTLDGITLQQANLTAATPPTQVDVGLYMTNGCKYDSVMNCYMNLQNRYYTTVGFMVITALHTTAPGVSNVGNKFVNDTVVAWNGAVISSNITSVLDSNNEITASTQGRTFFNLGLTNASYISTYSTMYGIQVYGQSNLVIRNIKLSGGAYGLGLGYFTLYGIYSPGYLTDPLITNNLLTNLGYSSNTVSGQYVYGIYLPASNTLRPVITNNTISDVYEYYGYGIYVSSCYQPLIQGNTYTRINNYYMPSYYCIYTSGNQRARIIGNKIKDFRMGNLSTNSNTNTFYGIYSGNTGPTVIANNMISGIKNYGTATSNTVYALYFTQSAIARDSIVHNSIWLDDNNATPTLTSYAMYISPNTSSGAEIYILNNIIGNRNTYGGASYAYGIYRTTTLGSVFTDYNDYYVNTTGSTDLYHVTAYNGANYYQASDWKTANVSNGNDQHSFAELPSWNTSDSLHISPSTTRLAGGLYLSNIPTDYDGSTRSTSPVIGAHEASGLTASSTDDAGPAIQVRKQPRTSSTSGYTVTANINDPSGVATGTNAPRLYYRAMGAVSFSYVSGTSSGNTWSFALPSMSYGVYQYYVAAQDGASTPNVSTFPFGGSGTTPPGTTAPSTFDTLRVVGLMSGDYLVGGSSPAFTSLKAALDSLNNSGVSGPVRFLINTSTLTETPAPIIRGPIFGGSTTNTVTIKPNTGITATLTATPSIPLNNWVLEVYGGSNVIIDGSNTNGGTTRDLTIQGYNSTTDNLIPVFLKAGVGPDGTVADITNITVKNLNVRGGRTINSTVDRGIQVQSGPSSTYPYSLPGTRMDNITITNNYVGNLTWGIIVVGEHYSNLATNVSITNNQIGGSVDSMYQYGILLNYMDGAVIDNNDIQHLAQSTANGSINQNGIQIGTGVTNSRITRNKIHNVTAQSTSGTAYGIYEVSSAPPTQNLIANNMVYDMHAGISTSGTSSTSPALAGIYISTGQRDIIANNTVHLFDTVTTSTSASVQYTEAFALSSGAYGLTVVNNIFSNGAVVGQTNGRNFAFMGYYGSSQLALSDNNIFYAPGSKGLLGYRGYVSQQISSFDSLRAWTGGDNRSWIASAPFTSLTNPHLLASVPTRAESGGIPVAGVTTDIDGDTRNSTTPDIGADEGNFATSAVDIAINTVSMPTPNLKIVAGTGFRSIISATNYGSNTAYNIPVVTQVIDSTTLGITSVSGTIDSLRAGEIRQLVIDSVSFPLVRTYGVRIYVNNATDALRANDSSSVIRVTAAAGLSGLYTVGVGRWAPTLKAAFDSLVTNGIASNVTFSLTDATYNEPAFTTSYIGNAGLILGANASRRLRIKPASGVSPVVNFYGSTSVSITNYGSTSYPGLGIINTQYMTIDGSNTEGGTTRDMTLWMHPATTYSAPLSYINAANDSVTNCVIRDSTYYVGLSGSPYTTIGVYLSAPSGSATGCSNVVINNNWIRDAYYGVYNYGIYPALNRNIQITNNRISRFGYYGIYDYYYNDNTLIQGNTFTSDTTAAVSYQYGIIDYGQYGTSRILGNRFQRFRSAYSSSKYFYGISQYYGGSLIANNVIAFDHDTNTTTGYFYPLYIQYSGYSTYPLTNLYYNTVYTGGSTTYTSSYGIYYYYSGGDFKNNVIVWNRAYAPSYFLYQYDYPAVPMNWNHNLYALGSSTTPSYWSYYYNGSTYYYSNNLAGWVSNTGKDSNSYAEQQVWADSVNANFAPSSSVATRLEGHAEVIPGITTDINGNPRDSRYPDMGAYEGSFISKRDIDMHAVSITAPVAGTRYFSGTSIAASATFQQAGLATATNIPIIYQAIDASGAIQATTTNTIASLSTLSSASAGTFTFTPNTRGTWTIRAIAAHPKEEYTIDDTVSITIRVVDGLAGTYYVGVGQWAPTMKAAIDSLNDQGIRNAVTWLLTDNSYSEPSLTINPPFGEALGKTITIKPNTGALPVVTFNSTGSTPWGLRLNSAKYVTIDGSNTVGGTTRDMKWQIGNASGLAAILVADSIGGDGATSTTIKNTKVYGGGTSAAYYGICVGGMTAGSAGSNNSVTIQNNEVRNTGMGICATGLSLNPTTNLIITQNTIGPAVGDNSNRIGVDGIRLGYVTSPQVTRNEIMGAYSTANSVAGIELTAGATSVNLTKNKIHDVEAKSSSYRALGVLDNSGSATQFVNNMIWHVTSGMANATSAGVNAGIFLGSTSGATLYFNSIYLSGNRDTVAATSGLAQSAALYVTSGASAVVSRNNIYASKQTEVSGGAKAYGVVFENATSISSADNDMFSGLGTKAGLIGRVATTDYTRMADLRGALGSREANGFGADVLFVSDADLHINPITPSLVESGGAPIAGITDDVDGDTRNAIKPDVGADEGAFANAVDIVAVSIDNPIANSVYRPFARTTAPVVTFRNAATGTGTNIPVSFVTIDSLVMTTTVSNRTIPTLGPNASTQVTFDSLVLPDIGSYGLKAYANYAFDVDNTNDTVGVLTVKVCAPMFGTYYIGAGRDFTSLALAAKTLHDCGVQAQVRMFLTDNVYNETTPITFTGITGLTGANTVTIRPNVGVNPVMNITTQVGTDYGILLDSVTWVTLDGANAAGATTRNWRINLTGPNANVNAIAMRDGSRNQVQNLTIRSIAMTAGTGILVQPTRLKMSNVLISNNDISNTQIGIMVGGAPFVDSNLTVQNNVITRWSQSGIQVGDMSKTLMIRGNTVRSDTTATSTSMTGIAVAGANTTDIEIGANKVMDFNTSGTNPVLTAISLSNTGTTATRVYDNMLSLGRQTALANASMYGVQLLAGASARMQSNTIALGGTASSGSSYGVYLNSPVNLTFYNNIVANARTNATGATGRHFGFYALNAPTGALISDYNDLYVPGTGGMLGSAAGLDMSTLVMWRTFTNGTPWGLQDRNSFSEAPSFVGTSDLHLTLTPSRLQNGGMPGLMGPNGQPDYDIDGTVRGYIADVGAFEFDGPRAGRLRGAYTIGDSASAYARFTDAVAALNSLGVDGPVDFYLSRTTETVTSPVRLVAADGISANWPVRFHPATGYTSTILGRALGTANLPAVIIFDSAVNNVTFDGDNGTNNGRITVRVSNEVLGYANSAIVLTNGASSNVIRNVDVSTKLANVRINPESDGFGVITLLGGVRGGMLLNNLIENDSISNGSAGVYSYAPATNWSISNLTVRKSKISDFNSSGIFFGTGTTASFADGNYITTNVSPGAASTVRGIRVSSDDNSIGNRAGNNWVIAMRSNGMSNVSGIDLTDGQSPMIFNNFISLDDYTTGSVRGIDEASSSTSTMATAARIFFNSINIYGDKNITSQSDYALAISTADNISNADSVVNNIFSLHRNNYGPNVLFAIGLAQFGDVTYANNNDYYTPSGSVAQVGLINYSTLSALRAAPSWSTRDLNSITGDPVFRSNTDLHLGSYNSAVFNKGQYLTSVTTDIDYQGRDLAPKTEIGADENGAFGVLPIELMSLEARGMDKKVELTFSTANESQISGFAILRSAGTDGHFTEIASASSDRSLVARGNGGRTTDYSFTDHSVTNGETYYYQIASIENDGSRKQYEKVAVATPNAPFGFAIESLYPNPYRVASGDVTIGYTLNAASESVQLVIADVSGHTVRTLLNGPVEKAGTFTATWDGADDNGSQLASGTYFVTLTATIEGSVRTTTAKIVVAK